MSEPTPSARRYREVVEEIGKRFNFERGWKSRAAALLAVHPSFISKVMSKEGISMIGTDVIQKAVAAGFDHASFFEPTHGHAPRPSAQAAPPALVESELLAWERAGVAGSALLASVEMEPTGEGFRVKLDAAQARRLAESVLEMPHVLMALDVLKNPDSAQAVQLAGLALALQFAAIHLRNVTDRDASYWWDAAGTPLDTYRWALQLLPTVLDGVRASMQAKNSSRGTIDSAIRMSDDEPQAGMKQLYKLLKEVQLVAGPDEET